MTPREYVRYRSPIAFGATDRDAEVRAPWDRQRYVLPVSPGPTSFMARDDCAPSATVNTESFHVERFIIFDTVVEAWVRDDAYSRVVCERRMRDAVIRDLRAVEYTVPRR